MLLSHVLILLRDENDLSHSQVVIDKVPSSFKAKYIFGKAKASTFFRVADIESGRSFFLYFISSQKLYQRSYSAARPVKFGKSLR